MDKPKPFLPLQAADRLSLSACAADVQDFDRWLTSLPRQQFGAVGQHLYKVALELNRLHAQPALKLDLLDRLRSEVDVVCRQFDQHVMRTPTLDERTAKMVALCQALQTQLAAGYKQVALDKMASLPIATAALHRTLSTLAGPLLRTAQLYRPAPAGLWYEAHGLYLIAQRKGVERTPVTDDQSPGSVRDAYLTLLSFASARTHQLRPAAIQALLEWLSCHATHCELQSPPAHDARFFIDSDTDVALSSRRPEVQAADACAHSFDVRPLLSLIQAAAGDGLHQDTRAHLSRIWGDAPTRLFNRTVGSGHLNTCVGMTAVHTTLGGGHDFADQLRVPDHTRASRYSLDHASHDIWSSVLHAQAPTDWLGMPCDAVEFQASRQGGGVASQPLDIHRPEIINHSPGGYCLHWHGTLPPSLQAGELLAVEDRPGGWSLAVIRWLNKRATDTRMGVELLSPKAQSCGLQMIFKMRQESDYVRGLLLPAVSALSMPATLLAPRLPFHEGCKVTINVQGRQRRALLVKCQSSTPSFSRFEYRWLDAAPEPMAPDHSQAQPLGDPDRVARPLFDSPFKSL